MKKYCVSALPLLILLLGCSSKKSSNPQPSGPPGSAALVSPSQNELCTVGTIVSDSMSTINFQWSASTYTTGYKIVITNLLNQKSADYTSSLTNTNISLLRNTPYSWYVVSNETGFSSVGTSPTWKFYNAGIPDQSYAPYPAELVSPVQGTVVTGSTVNLVWTGSSVDNDIINYDVYFGKGTNPPIYKSAVKNSYLDNVPVVSGTTYHWKVITRDSVGNTSESQLFGFSR